MAFHFPLFVFLLSNHTLSLCMCVCVCVRIFIKLHITTQSSAVISSHSIILALIPLQAGGSIILFTKTFDQTRARVCVEVTVHKIQIDFSRSIFFASFSLSP